MNGRVVVGVAAVLLSGLSCVTGAGVLRVREATSEFEREESYARYKRLEPPPRPLYAAPGPRFYARTGFVCLGTSVLLLLVGAGVALVSAVQGPPAPAPGEGVVFRRNPTFECLLLVVLLMSLPALLGGLAMAKKNPAALAFLLFPGFPALVLLFLHAGTARVADAEGITLGLGRRFRWADVVSCTYVSEVQRTSSGATRTVGGYHRVQFQRGSIKLRSHRYANWEECWRFVEPRVRPGRA